MTKVANQLRTNSVKDRCRLSGTHHPLRCHSWIFWWENALKMVESHTILMVVCFRPNLQQLNPSSWFLRELLNCGSDLKLWPELGLFVESRFLASRFNCRIKHCFSMNLLPTWSEFNCVLNEVLEDRSLTEWTISLSQTHSKSISVRGAQIRFEWTDWYFSEIIWWV